jgi:hypothetical protein
MTFCSLSFVLNYTLHLLVNRYFPEFFGPRRPLFLLHAELRSSRFFAILVATIAAAPALSHPIARRQSELASANSEHFSEEHFDNVLAGALDSLYVFPPALTLNAF